MSDGAPASPRAPSQRKLLVLFFLSGISGLVYEVVWVRMLIRAFGVTVYAVSTVLAVFMTGLALGGFVAGRKLRGKQRLLRFYAATEVAIGISASLATGLILAMPEVFKTLAPLVDVSGVGTTLIRFVLSTVALLPPTFLMGATLPMLSGHVATDPSTLGRRVGVLYGVNTLGAMVGVLGSGLFSLMVLGELPTVLVAAALNVVVGALAFAISQQSGAPSPGPADAPPEPAQAPPATGGEGRLARALMLVYALSGVAALGYQVVWSRMLNLVLGNSVYSFSLTLAAYLLGIGVGSLVMAQLAERLSRPLVVFGALEMGLAILAIASLHVFTLLGLSERNSGATYVQIQSIWDFPRLGLNAVVIVLPVTLVLGALFPLATKLCAPGNGFTQETVGKLYGMNTVGSIVGSFIGGFMLLPYLGTLKSFLLLAIMSFAIGAWLLRLDALEHTRPFPRVPALVLLLVFIGALSVSLEDPFLRVLRKHIGDQNEVVLHEEDKAATITAVQSVGPDSEPHWKHLYINGIVTSSTDIEVGNAMIWMPLSFHPSPKRSLIVGLGVGEAFRASLDMKLDTTVVDLVPSIAEFFKFYHPDDFQKYLSDPNGRIVFNDGRNFLLTTRETFDHVFVDGTPPVYSSGTVNLYSREFTELVRDHLSESGIYTLWFPAVCFESDFWVVARNFVDLFPHVTLWAFPGASGVILSGTRAKEPIFDVPPDVVATRLAERSVPGRPGIVTSELIRVGRVMSEDLIRSTASRFPQLTDDHPYTEFPLLNFIRNEKYYHSTEFISAIADRRPQARAQLKGSAATP